MSRLVSLGIRRHEGEAWRACVIRYAKAHGLEREVAESFDDEISGGSDEETAAWSACYEWDICDLMTAVKQS